MDAHGCGGSAPLLRGCTAQGVTVPGVPPGIQSTPSPVLGYTAPVCPSWAPALVCSLSDPGNPAQEDSEMMSGS